MKEIICPECHKLVRTAGNSCPNCGYPFKNIKTSTTQSNVTNVPLHQIKKVYVKDDDTIKRKKRKRKSTFGTESLMILTIMFGILLYTFIAIIPSMTNAEGTHIIVVEAINNFIGKFTKSTVDFHKMIKLLISIYLIISCSVGVLRSKIARGISSFMTFILFTAEVALAILGFIYKQPPTLMYFVLLIMTIVWVAIQLIYLTKENDEEPLITPIEVTNEETEGYIKELEHINELLQKRIITESEYKKLKTKIINTKIEGK